MSEKELQRLLSQHFAFRTTVRSTEPRHSRSEDGPAEAGELDHDDRLLRELAGLSPEAREQRIQMRRRYEQFARHQRLVEVEEQADRLRFG